MARGRRPEPTAGKVLRGTFRADRANAREPRPQRGAPQPPKHLSGDSLREWERLVGELDAMKVLTTADRGILEVAASSWAEWRQAERAIARHGLLVRGAKGGRVRNPAQAIRREARLAYQRALIELGLTPAARARVKVRPSDEDQQAFGFQPPEA